MLASIRTRLVVQAAMVQEAHEWQNAFARKLGLVRPAPAGYHESLESMNRSGTHHKHHCSPSPPELHSPIASPAHIVFATWELCENTLKQLSCADLERIRSLNRTYNAVVKRSFNFSHALHGLATL
jgi:hypothetical protein